MSIRAIPPPPPLTTDARLVFGWAAGLMVSTAATLAMGDLLRPGAGAAAMALFAALLLLLDRQLAAYHPHRHFGRANRITLLRAGIACLLAARARDPRPLTGSERWALAAVAAAALVLDGADGRAARRDGLCSRFGARFDMEVDAFAILALCGVALKASAAPGWTLAMGLMRYAYVAAGAAAPVLRRALPTAPLSMWRRKAIAVCQPIALIAALIPAVDRGWAACACFAALTLLAYSFAADIVLLLRETRAAGPGPRARRIGRRRISGLPDRSPPHMMADQQGVVGG
jgi:phosphatidylglycerophosphate synthase